METSTNATLALIPDSLKRKVAEELIAALKEENWELLRDIVTEDITWTLPGNSIIAGRAIGAEAVIKRAKIMVSFGVASQLNHMLIALNGVALTTHNKATRNALELDEYVATVFTFRGDKISAINTLVSDIPGIDSFFTLKNMDLHDANIAQPVIEMSADQVQRSAIANTFTSALKNNNWELMRSIMNEDIKWTLPGSSLLSGPAYGVDAVIKRVRSLKQFGVMFELRHIVYGMQGFALLLHNTAKRNDLILDEYVAIVFDIAEGRVQRMTTHLSDVPGIEEFFIPGII